MECNKYRSLLEEWLDGDLSGEERAGFERHLMICADCAQYLKERRRLGTALKKTMTERTAGLRFQSPPLSGLLAAERVPKHKLRLRFAPWSLLTLTAMVLVALLFLFHPWTAPRHETVAGMEPTAEITVSDSLDAGDESFISGRINGFTYLIHVQVYTVKIDDHS